MDDIRNKLILVKVNNTNNPDWYHYEPRAVLQKKVGCRWVDIPKYFVMTNDAGEEIEIGESEYYQYLKKLK